MYNNSAVNLGINVIVQLISGTRQTLYSMTIVVDLHLRETFIQSDIQYIQSIHFYQYMSGC